MYRISPIGIAAKSGLGLDPDTLVSYIKQAREVVAGTPLAAARFGHVDTSNAWVNASNAAVAEAVDWIGMDAYPFFETTMTNDIGSAKGLFEKAINEVKAATGNKELLITETGWPISGPSQNLGVASLDNAEMFWQEVGCAVFDKISTWWYILSETGAEPDFSVVVDPSNPTPKYNLVCKSNAGLNLAGASTSSATATTVTSTNSTSGQGFNSASSSNSSSSGSGSSSNPGSGTSTAPTTTGTPHSAANAKFFSAGAAVVAVLAAVLAL